MRIIFGQAHREAVLKKLTPGCRLLEWGSGGSTLWLADRLPVGATLTSIDHDPEWHSRVKERIGHRDNVRLLLRPANGPLGRNATIEEENSTYLQDYIQAVDGELFDVILVDGVARVSCMQQATKLLAPNGTLFLHDAHRPWYDDGKAFYFEHGTIGSCHEYPGPTLWWGGLRHEEPRYSVGALPIIVNFYTKGTPYEQEVDRLRNSVQSLGMEAEFIGTDPLDSWEHNCAYKAQFIHDIYSQFDRPVLWLDADAVVHSHPLLVAGAEPDFAINKANGWQFASGTVYFNRTELGELLLKQWLLNCQERPDIWDQIHLDSAWEKIHATRPLHTMWLPQTYTKIFDAPWETRIENIYPDPISPVIEHYQASRRYKTSVSKHPSLHMKAPSQELISARLACRSRTVFYDERYVLKKEIPSPDAWALDTESTESCEIMTDSEQS
jgi:SAM-dependent methyltransferase